MRTASLFVITSQVITSYSESCFVPSLLRAGYLSPAQVHSLPRLRCYEGFARQESRPRFRYIPQTWSHFYRSNRQRGSARDDELNWETVSAVEFVLSAVVLTRLRLASKEKYCIIIFPEGTRAPTKELLPFKVGAFQTALRARVPVVPIVIANHEDYAGRDVLPIQILGKPMQILANKSEMINKYSDPIYPNENVNSDDISSAAKKLSLETRQKMAICYKNLSENIATAKSWTFLYILHMTKLLLDSLTFK